MQYRVECLENELQDALQVIEQQKGQVKVVRDENDLAKIAEQEEAINNLQSELAYVKKELIEARAHKSASDDKLSTVQDKIETMQNNINSLSDEGKLDQFPSNRYFLNCSVPFFRKINVFNFFSIFSIN